MPPRRKYVSCQNPVPPESFKKFCHHCRCGSERVHSQSEFTSRQYWRMPACIGNNDHMKYSWRSSPSGCAVAEEEIFGTKPSSVQKGCRDHLMHTWQQI